MKELYLNCQRNQFMFTVFTPVYNGRHTIHRVWESLLLQTCREFEWIIVDDGSTDNVEPLLKEYKQQAEFPVTILTQPNSGKHIAWNRALDVARGELFIPADSDDEFVPETLETFAKYWEEIPANERVGYSGINVLCKDSKTGEIVGEKFPESPMASNNLELYYKYKVRGEKWGCVRTDILKKRLFPEIKTGRGCFSLSWLWFWIAHQYEVLCVNEALRIYYQDDDNSITKQSEKKKLESANGNYMATSWHLETNINYLIKYESKLNLIKSFISLWCLGLLTNRKFCQIVRDLNNKLAKTLAIFFYLPAVALYCLTYRKLTSTENAQKT